MKINPPSRPSRHLIKRVASLGACGVLSGFAAGPTPVTAPVTLVNPLRGTDSQMGFSHGNEYPAICLPFPMNTWAPYTQPERDSFYYQYRQPKLRGIRLTHQPSPWIGDYAAFALMPVSGKLAVTEDERASEFRHDEEVVLDMDSVPNPKWASAPEARPASALAQLGQASPK